MTGRIRGAVTTTRKRWGYLVWGTAAVSLAVPEIWAAKAGNTIPWTTASAMVGHLEYRWNWVALIVIPVIVFAVIHTIRFQPRKASQAESKDLSADSDYGVRPISPNGRLTVRNVAPRTTDRSDEDVDWPLGALAASSFVVIGVSSWATAHFWDDQPNHHHTGYVLYGLIALCWIVIPSYFAVFHAREAPFPKLSTTIVNFQDWLRSWHKKRVGALAATAFAWVILSGLTILVFHLTLYPYPDISHIIDPTDGNAKKCAPPGVVLTANNNPKGLYVYCP